ncbi:DEAD/DEAH box helicase [Pseudooceanicola sp.]|uniref:DEAD/DEAH box helicase n=1 Tax=Pseudooceanicola sp. TaxID=1914328 RepID=UPI0026234845|nr:DEAD/DEAH box helicase [Pseudooceanicola sp.]MDF1854620.1 DEAD/DEAH box helicase [Pseudooceanicola sp.]
MIQTLSDALAERGYDTLTPVQEAVTTAELQDADLLVSAQTGSGKTVGFGLAIGPTLMGAEERLPAAAAPLALIIAPTRELAFQVSRELGWLFAKAGARVATCVGGMDMRDERRALDRGAHIVVGTPGRLRDHIQRGSLDLTSIRAVVLDEADEMLDLGFREDLEFMLGEAPAERRTLMFSATVPKSIATLAQHYQRDAVRVTTLSDRSQHADIAYQALQVAQADAENAIINVLRYHDSENAIVFANTRAAVNRLMARFANRGFAVVCLSGELSQTERSHALQAMRDGRARVCVATDVAARGIDLPNLDLVVHAELPTNAEGLLHRSGRTGRAGRKGISALIVPPKMMKRADRLLKTAKITAEWTTAPGADEILRRDEERLLADPVWTEAASEEEDAFAAKLLEMHPPQAIAAAYLRLYRAGHSAPEDLASPTAAAAPRERKPFGPSVWFALSVGRNDRAEPRWLLPLLCRAGNIEKDSIGAIRIQPTESFVELTESSLPGFLKAIGSDGKLEDGVTIRRIEGTPDFARHSDSPPAAKPRPSAPRKPAAPRPAPTPQAAAPAPHAGAGAKYAAHPGAPQKPARAAPKREAYESRPAKHDAPKKSHPPRDGDPATSAPRKAKGDRPYSHAKDTGSERKSPARVWGQDRAKPAAGAAKSGSGYKGKPGGPAGKPGGSGKFGGGKPKPAASDTSKRFKPPRGAAKAKPADRAGGKRRDGGHDVPKRNKP